MSSDEPAIDTPQLDLLLIRPGDQKQVFGELSSSLSAIEPPIWAALIAAYVRQKAFSVKIIDAEGDNLTPSEVAQRTVGLNPRLAAFVVTGNNLSASAWNMAPTRSYVSALNEKKKGNSVKTLLWGLHPSSIPEMTLKEENVDFVCEGEGFYTYEELLKLLKENPDAADFPPSKARRGRV